MSLFDDAYRSAADAAVKRAILRSFMTSGDRARLLALAKGEKDAALRGEAVQQLGVMGAHAELAELYQMETAPEVKKRMEDIAVETAKSSPKELATLTRADADKWGKIIKQLGITPQ